MLSRVYTMFIYVLYKLRTLLRFHVSRITIRDRIKGTRSWKEVGQEQQLLSPAEEASIVNELYNAANRGGHPGLCNYGLWLSKYFGKEGLQKI